MVDLDLGNIVVDGDVQVFPSLFYWKIGVTWLNCENFLEHARFNSCRGQNESGEY